MKHSEFFHSLQQGIFPVLPGYLADKAYQLKNKIKRLNFFDWLLELVPFKKNKQTKPTTCTQGFSTTNFKKHYSPIPQTSNIVKYIRHHQGNGS